MIAAHTYRVDVERQGSAEINLSVTLPPATYQALCAGGVTHEWLIVQAIRWLQERGVELLPELDLEQLVASEPEFADAMRALLIEPR